MTFTGNEVRGTHLVFSKEEISRFHIYNFESGRSLGRKVHFFNSLGTTKISKSLRLSVHINLVLLINFLEQFELCLYLKYSRSYIIIIIIYKFYNPGDKTFETDFSLLILSEIGVVFPFPTPFVTFGT